jgi:hypothetical protein
MDPLTKYYLRQAGAAADHIAEAVGPVYTVTPFLQRGD